MTSTAAVWAKTLKKFSPRKNSQILVRYHSFVCHGKPRRKSNASLRRCFSDHHLLIVKSSYPEIKLPEAPLHEYVFENLGQWEDKIALECGASGKKWTFKELYKYSKNLACALQTKFNLKKGDHLAIVLPNCPEYPAIYLAGSMTGVVSTTVNPMYTPTEISRQFEMMRPQILFTVPDVYPKCVETLKITNLKIPIVIVQLTPEAQVPPGAVSFNELIKTTTPTHFKPVEIDINDDLVLPFSSGTSGFPKGVQLTHKNVNSNLAQFADGNFLKSNPDKETGQTLILGLLPMYHIYGMVIITFDAIREGARLVILPKFEPKLFVETLFTKRVQLLYLAPPLIIFLGNHPSVEAKYLKYVQNVVNGSAPCGELDILKLKKKNPDLSVCQGYGLTETSPVITMSHKDRFHKLSSVGHPLVSTMVKVVDVKTGKILPEGSRGEICCKGPQVMKGYYNKPQETKDTFDEDGWFKTGDIGYYDEDHDFFIVDRLKELIKVKGFQVAPAELEEFLRNYPKILDAGVVGISHPEFGQVPKAFVVLKDGASASEEEIQNFIKERLSSYKHLLGGVCFLKAIPKSAAGKILRRELLQMEKESR